MELFTSTVERLLLGNELEREPWLHLTTQLNPSGGSEEEEVLRTLARLVTTEEVHTLDALAKSIPAWHKPLAALGEAIAATRTLDVTSVNSLNAFVYSAFALLPYLKQRTLMPQVVERLARLQARAIDLCGDPLNLSAACMFANLANTLAMSLENPGYLDAALGMADRLHRCPSEEGRYMAISNLVTTCKQLAKYRPQEAEHYLLRGVELASGLYESRREIARLYSDPSLARYQPVHALFNLVQMHAGLAAIRPAHSAEHAAAAWSHASHLQQLTDEYGDPDLRQQAEGAEDFLLEQVGALPGAPLRRERTPLTPSQALADQISTSCQAAWEAAQRVWALPAGAGRHRAIVEYLQQLYGSFASALQLTILEVGINRPVSRLLLALGAVASGRLWPLSLPAVHACVLDPPPYEEGSSHAHEVQRAQERPSRQFFALGLNCPALLCALATFCDKLSSDEELAGMLRTVLREQNRMLLELVLPAAAQPQHVPHRQLEKIDDLAEIMMLVHGFGSRREPAPPAAEAEHAEAAGARAEAATSTGETSLPELDWVEDPEPDGSRRREDSPESKIGITGRLNGEPYKIDSILGMGTQKVVFGLTHQQTGHQLALARLRASFDPRVRLAKYLERVESGEQPYHPEEMIERCDAVLARHPHDWAAGFNKGTALMIQEDFAGAINVFQLVLEGDPDDPYSLFYTAYALTRLGQHSGAVVYLSRAARLHPNEVHELFRTRGSVKEEFAASVREVLREAPDRADALQLLREHFS